MASSRDKPSFPALQSSQGQLLATTDELQEDDLESGYTGADSETESQHRKAKKREKIFCGVKLSPDIVVIAMVYFVQGVLGLSRLAVNFFLKDDLHLDPAETAVISGVSAAPWLIKPLYGFISDGLPLFGYRRRSYLVLCGLLGASAWATMAMFVDNKYGAAIAILLSSLSVAFSDVVVDSMAVERAHGESQSTSGSIQSLCWGSSATGGIVSAYFSGSLIETYGVRFVFSVTSLLPLLTSAVAVFVREDSSTQSLTTKDVKEVGAMATGKATALELAKAQLFYLWKTIKEPAIFFPTIFIFFWQATPTSDTAMFFFSTNKLGFGPEFLGRVRLVTSIASLAGVGLYNGFLKGVPLRKMFFWTTLLGCGLSLTQLVLVTGANQQLGMSNEWFAMGDTLILTVLGQGDCVENRAYEGEQTRRDEGEKGDDSPLGPWAMAADEAEPDLDDANHGEHEENGAHDGAEGGQNHAESEESGAQEMVVLRRLIVKAGEGHLQFETLGDEGGEEVAAEGDDLVHHQVLGHVRPRLARAHQACLLRGVEGDADEDCRREEGVDAHHLLQRRHVQLLRRRLPLPRCRCINLQRSRFLGCLRRSACCR